MVSHSSLTTMLSSSSSARRPATTGRWETAVCAAGSTALAPDLTRATPSSRTVTPVDRVALTVTPGTAPARRTNSSGSARPSPPAVATRSAVICSRA